MGYIPKQVLTYRSGRRKTVRGPILRSINSLPRRKILNWPIGLINEGNGIEKLTPSDRIVPEENLSLAKKYSAVYGTRSFITMFTTTGHWTLFCAR
jgi:hypothetical protein